MDLASRERLGAAIAVALAVAGAGACAPQPPSPCGDGLAFCQPRSALDPFCVDLSSDRMNCGSCGSVCPLGGSCVAGRCACPAGQDVCAEYVAFGVCVDLSSDDANCGTCGFSCGAGSCVSGACACDTSPGVVRCTGSPACANTSSDPFNCGACGAACPLFGEACVDGTCACPASRPDVCPVGVASACVSLQTDASHCGTCATACPLNGVCAAGVCACPPGTTLCAAGDVCADLSSDASNCGACGAACDGTCVGGVCQPAPPQSCGFIGDPCCPGLFCYAGACNGVGCW